MGKYYALSRGLLTACCLSSCPSFCCFSKTFLVNCQGTGHFFFVFSFAILNSSSGHYVLCNSTANSPGLFNIYLVHSWNGINLSGDIKGAGRNQCRKIPAVYSFAQNLQKVHSGGGRRLKRDLCVTQPKSHWPGLPVPACNSPLDEYNTCLMEWAESPPITIRAYTEL